MKVAVIGSGYVGLVSGACLAEMGNTIFCVDIDKRKIDLLKDGVIPIYEPGLEDLVKSNVQSGRLHFTTQFEQAIHHSEIIMIAVGTPPNEDGSADLQHVLKVAEDIGRNMNAEKVIVNKSTVPVGTADKVRLTVQKELSARGLNIPFSVASNPEFLKEGAAIADFMKPDRIVVGCDSERAQELMQALYQPFVLNGHRIIFMDIKSAELTKYAANAMLATKISFMNEIARVAESVGADISAVRQGIGSDSRIGFHFIYPGIGYGGSCFPKDVKALVQTGKQNQLELKILNSVEDVNKTQRQFFVDKIKKHFAHDLTNKTFAIWGLSFKPETDDIREAPSLEIIESLLASGSKVRVYDPISNSNVEQYFKGHRPELINQIEFCDEQYAALEGSDALLLITEWKPFRSPDFEKIESLLKHKVIFDGRNQYDPAHMTQIGLKYYGIGRKN